MATNKIEEITKEGREQLIKEREELLNVKIPECEAKVKAAREMGDTSENADYQFSKEELGRLKARRDQINYILENTKVVKNRETEKKVLLAKEAKDLILEKNLPYYLFQNMKLMLVILKK